MKRRARSTLRQRMAWARPPRCWWRPRPQSRPRWVSIFHSKEWGEACLLQVRVSFETSFDSKQPKLYPKQNICFGSFASIPKQRVSLFRLNRNKQKTNRNSLMESIFCFFSENLGLFRFVLKQFCLFRLFWYRFETPKQTETNQKILFLVSSSKPKHNRNRSCFGLFRFEQTFFLFDSRTLYSKGPAFESRPCSRPLWPAAGREAILSSCF